MSLLLGFSFSQFDFTVKASVADTYYVSSSTGNDTNNGLSPESAFKTFANINNKKLKAGEKVLLKCGDEFNERLEILGQGTSNSFIEVGSYGIGEKPIIRLNNEDNDIAILLKDFFRGDDGTAVASPIQYIKIHDLSIRDTRLGIFVRIYMTENSGKSQPSLQSKYVEIYDMEFENINSDVLPELNEAVNAEEAKYDSFSIMAANAINSVYTKKIDELHSAVKGDLPKIVDGAYYSTGGGSYEYVFPTAILVGGRKSAITDLNADEASSALQYFSVKNCEMRECITGIMCWFYNWNGQTSDEKFRANVQYIYFENIEITGCSASGIGLEGCDGGASLIDNSVVPDVNNWGRIKNIRIYYGAIGDEYAVPLGTTDVIIEKTINMLFEECEFIGMTNHNNCDGCGFDFEGNCKNVEVKNCVIAYNEGGAFLIMDNGSGSHKNLFIRNNLIYSNLQNAYHQYNNRNNSIESRYINVYNEGNNNVLIEKNTIMMQRYTTMGAEISLIGPKEESNTTYQLLDNYVKYYDDGVDYAEYSTDFSYKTDSAGSFTLENINLHTKRYGAMYITLRGATTIKGTIQGFSSDGTSSAVVPFETDTGYVDIASKTDWNIPYTDIKITLTDIKEGKLGTIEFIPNTNSFCEIISETQIKVTLTGESGAIFKENLDNSYFNLCNLITRKNIISVERLSLKEALITLDTVLTETDINYVELNNFINIKSGAYAESFEEVFEGYNVNRILNTDSYLYIQSLELNAKPAKLVYNSGEKLDLTGINLTALTSGETINLISSQIVISGYNSATSGKQLVKLSYMGKCVYFTVTVNDNTDTEVTDSGCSSNNSSVAILFIISALTSIIIITKKR
jgi:hypothetical protein